MHAILAIISEAERQLFNGKQSLLLLDNNSQKHTTCSLVNCIFVTLAQAAEKRNVGFLLSYRISIMDTRVYMYTTCTRNLNNF